jgi:hypothetical protein
MKWTVLKNGNLMLEEVTNRDLVKKNFSGERSAFGTRSIGIRVPEELIDFLTDNHFNVWERKSNEAGEYMDPVVEANIAYFEDPDDTRNPNIRIISSKKMVRIKNAAQLTRENLDHKNFSTMDILIRSFARKRPTPGFSTAVVSLNFVLDDYNDPVQAKYSDIPYEEDDE